MQFTYQLTQVHLLETIFLSAKNQACKAKFNVTVILILFLFKQVSPLRCGEAEVAILQNRSLRQPSGTVMHTIPDNTTTWLSR